jgi:LPXTG-motif cell wall-anchored protein
VPVTDDDGRLPEVPPGFVSGRDDAGAVQVELSRLETGAWTIEGSGYRMRLELSAAPTNPSDDQVSEDALLEIATVQAGTEVLAAGEGLAPGTFVDVWVFSEPRLLGRLLVDANGDTIGTLPVPADLVAGDHTLQINGQVPGGGLRSISLGIRVLAALEQVPESTTPGTLPATGTDPRAVLYGAIVAVMLGSFLVSRRRFEI